MKKLISVLFCCILMTLAVSCGLESFFGGGYKAVTGDVQVVSFCSVELSGSVRLPDGTSADLAFGVLVSEESGVLMGNAGKYVATSFDEKYHFVITVDGLEAETTYYYRTFIYDDEKVYYGETKSFTTPAIVLSSGPVDMGLSVKWASCNLGAQNPWDCGNYYAWGETSVKSRYDWSTYIWCTGNDHSMTKYCTEVGYGVVDNKDQLEKADDAAAQELGGTWRMATDAEWTELRENCIWSWAQIEGVTGRLVASKKTGKCIFLPAAGFYDGTNLKYKGLNGHYWSSSLIRHYPNSVWNVDFTSSNVVRDEQGSRFGGQSIRPVCE